MIPLKYGCNPHQTHALIRSDGPMPLEIVNGTASMINILDALRGWQLVRDVKAATGKPAATSFKHVSPAGAAVAGPLTDDFCTAHFYPAPADHDYSPIASAYAKARSSDRVASFGDFIAVSEPVDASLALLIKPEVSDGIIAPGYDDDALAILTAKQSGSYRVLKIDPDFQPPAVETRTLFGVTIEESFNDVVIDRGLLSNTVTEAKDWSDDAIDTMLTITATLKHTQSNSVAVGWNGQAVGIGAGQQSRIACVRLACGKADRFALKQHPKSLDLAGRFKPGTPRPAKVNLLDQYTRYVELDDREKAELADAVEGDVAPISAEEAAKWIGDLHGVCLSSDAFFPFRDNLDRAVRSSVKYVLHAGGSKRDEDVTAAADEHRMVMALSGLRLFLH